MLEVERFTSVIFESEGGAGADTYHWVHFKRSASTERQLLEDPDIPEQIAWALLEEDTQPRVLEAEGVVAIILRGINQQAGAEPEDMISFRLAVSGRRIVSVELRRLGVIDRLIAEFRAGRTPPTQGAFVVHLIETLRMVAEPELDALERDILELELSSARAGGFLTQRERARLADTRQDAILIHRFIAPQSLAIETLLRHAPRWLDDPGSLREEAEAFRRIASDLEAVRSRGQIVSEELSSAQAERTNRTVVLLSVVSVVFLPLTFLTGLLGVNLEGIPYAESEWSFPAFAGILVAVAGLSAFIAARFLR